MSAVNDPFGMTVHDMSLGDISESYCDTNVFRKKQDIRPRKTNSIKENELTDQENETPPRKNVMFNRVKSRQIVRFAARKTTSNVHSPKEVRNEEAESLSSSPVHLRFGSDLSDVSKQTSPIDIKASSPIPLSPKEATSNVMVTPTWESRVTKFYGCRPSTCSKLCSKLSLKKSPRTLNSLQKRVSTFNAATNLHKKRCISPNRSENKENEDIFTEDKHLSTEGFKNLGTTCYMNAGLQAIFNSQSLAEDMMSTFHEIKDHLGQNDSFRAITKLLIELKKSVSKYSEDHYETLLKEVKEAIDLSCNNFQGMCMQDAQEFHNKIVHTMKEEISMATEKIDTHLINPIESNFKMTLVETLVCEECGNVVRTSQDAYDIALQVPSSPDGTLQSAMKTSFGEELREFNCSKCFHNQSKAKTTILYLPKILTIFLKRYQFSDGQVVKDEKSVEVPDFLTLQEFVKKQKPALLKSDCRFEMAENSGPSRVQNKDFSIGEDDEVEDADSLGCSSNARDMDYIYELTSAVCHQGVANAGHYVCYGLDHVNQTYKLYDDSDVSEVSKEAVSIAIKENGYLFLYTKKRL